MHNQLFVRWFGGVAILIGVLQLLGVRENLFYMIPWYDWPMHFLGGFWIGLIFAVCSVSFFQTRSSSVRVSVILIGTITVGVLWEFFELYLGITALSDLGYHFDTFHDLLMDALGGITAAYLSVAAKRQNPFSLTIR
jgi:hypothetical protein